MTALSPWVARFSVELSDDELDALMRVSVTPLVGLENKSPEKAAHELRAHLRTLVVPSAQARDVLRHLQSLALTYAELRFPSNLEFLRYLHTGEIDEFAHPPTCLTGLAGTGKSAILKAFQRIFGICEEVPLEGYSAFPFAGCWLVSTAANSGLTQMLSPRFRYPPDPARLGIEADARRETATQGVCELLADEFQFMSQSDANTLVAKRLLQLSRIGPPIVFAANFSLIWRLMRRPDEERQRLLSNPIVVWPDLPDSDDWIALVQALLAVVPVSSAIEAKAIAPLLHRYTFGIKRSVVRLLCQAYLLARLRSSFTIDVGDIERSYLSPAYLSTRTDVEVLAAREINESATKDDLSCPFGPMPTTQARQHAIQARRNEQERKAAQAALDAGLSCEERAASSSPRVPALPALARPKRPVATAESLLAGLAQLETEHAK